MIHAQYNDFLARERIRASGLAVHDPLERTSSLYLPTDRIERLLTDGLKGIKLADLPNKTKSKTFKIAAATALGYPIPAQFKRVKPRFLGQNLDLFVQSSRNVQIYNAAIVPDRRYAFAKVNDKGVIAAVRVVDGRALLSWGAGETATTKYQARKKTHFPPEYALDEIDIRPYLATFENAQAPRPIDDLRAELLSLVGESFADPGVGRERERGDAMHRLVSRALGITHCDNGQFPDIPSQLLEIKLQTTPTIDLGHTLPTSIAPLPGLARLGQHTLRHCDCRYAIFYAHIDNGLVILDDLTIIAGGAFFSQFKLSGGIQINSKIQRSIPLDFWQSLEI